MGSLPLKAQRGAREEHAWESEFFSWTSLCPPPPSASAAGPAATWDRTGHSAAIGPEGRILISKARERETAWYRDKSVEKINIYIDNGVEETFPQLPWLQVRCLEKTKALLHHAKIVHFNYMWELRDITVSLVSPSFMRRMSLAASRFLSRLQSSFRDTKPLRSIFSTYCNAYKHVSIHCDPHPQKTPKCTQFESYMSIFCIIEEIQRIPAQTGPQSPGCLSHTDTNRHVI